jgi:Arc/MetJ-type ribon-helix-helix transcriptional regulator
MQARNEQFVQSLLKQGEFATRDDVIDAALERWRLQRDEFASLRAMVQLGIDELDRGEGAPLDIDDVIARGRERLTAVCVSRK